MNAHSLSITASGIASVYAPKTLAHLVTWTRQTGEWLNLALTAEYIYGLENLAEPISSVKAKLEGFANREAMKREQGHWSYSQTRSAMTRQFLDLIEKFHGEGL